MGNPLKSRRGGSGKTYLDVRVFDTPRRRASITRRFREYPQELVDNQTYSDRDITEKNGSFYHESEEISNVYLVGSEITEQKKLDSGTVIGPKIVLQLLFVDGEDKQSFQLEFFAESSFGDSFFSIMHSIDVDKLLKIRPYSFRTKDTDKVKSGITFYQIDDSQSEEDYKNGKLLPTWTRDNPGGRPDWVIKETRTGKKIDKTDTMEFYYNEFDKFVDNIAQELGNGEAVEQEAEDEIEEKVEKKSEKKPVKAKKKVTKKPDPVDDTPDEDEEEGDPFED